LETIIMSTLADVQAHLTQVADGVSNLRGQIQTLKDQLATSPVTQEQLDALDAQVAAIVSSEQQP
jgi:septal ring factor EnvC (AmiA/AmiB activator)